MECIFQAIINLEFFRNDFSKNRNLIILIADRCNPCKMNGGRETGAITSLNVSKKNSTNVNNAVNSNAQRVSSHDTFEKKIIKAMNCYVSRHSLNLVSQYYLQISGINEVIKNLRMFLTSYVKIILLRLLEIKKIRISI